MKSTLHTETSSEFIKKHNSIGSSANPVKSYTSNDFLPPSKVAKKFNISTQEAEKLMQKLFVHRAIFGLNGHKSQIVLKHGKSNRLKLHPMATDAFNEFLQKQRG